VAPETEKKTGRDVWIFAEQSGGRPLPVVYELLAPGRRLAERLGGRLAAVLFGCGVAGTAEELLGWGADVVYKADAPPLEHYNSWLYPRLLERLVREEAAPPHSILIGATCAGMDLAPATAARLGVGCSAHCVALDLDEQGNLLQDVPGAGGTFLTRIVSPFSRPQIATVRPGMFAAPQPCPGGKKGEIRECACALAEEAPVRVLAAEKREEDAGVPLEKAEVVIAGGAGVNSREGWEIIRELASLLGAAVGATRPAVDAGWAKEAQLIGLSGKTVRPRLYIGIGISGDAMHTAGIQGAQKIVAINSNPQAPIFQMADYGIVADYREMLPLLLAAVAKEKNSRPEEEKGAPRFVRQSF
jgi:electron transfer flavoprotein alpha subunit